MIVLHISSDWDICLRKGILILGSQILSTGKLHVSLVVILETSMWLGARVKLQIGGKWFIFSNGTGKACFPLEHDYRARCCILLV